MKMVNKKENLVLAKFSLFFIHCNRVDKGMVYRGHRAGKTGRSDNMDRGKVDNRVCSGCIKRALEIEREEVDLCYGDGESQGARGNHRVHDGQTEHLELQKARLALGLSLDHLFI
jgi:hypothetical protein